MHSKTEKNILFYLLLNWNLQVKLLHVKKTETTNCSYGLIQNMSVVSNCKGKALGWSHRKG